MIYYNLAASAVSLPIYLLMLISLVGSRKNWKPYARVFYWILIAAMMQANAELLLDTPGIGLEGLPKWCVISLLNASCMLLTAFYSLYLLQFCRDIAGRENAVGTKWIYVVLIWCDAEIAFLTIMTLAGILYSDPFPVMSRMCLTMMYPFGALCGDIVMLLLNPIPKKRKAATIIFCMIPFCLPLLYIFTGSTMRSPIFLIQIVFLYCNIYTSQEQERIEQQLQLENTRSKLLFSQIEPHFIYNTLTGVISLCDEDPREAKELLYSFSAYLRRHLDSLQRDEIIPLAQELEHTRLYLEIEKVRFGDVIGVEYDIQTKDVFLPPLTLQPLVENAVKHGVTMKTGGGTIRISSWEDTEYVYVRIQDDGVGFDPAILEKNSHVGIPSIQLRLKNMVNGSLDITSKKGEGTTVLIRVPVEA